MSNYWHNRTVELEKLLQNKTSATIGQVNKLYVESSKTIASRIAKIFETYKEGGQLESQHALQLLSAKQTAEVRRELLEQLSKTTDKNVRREIISILDAPAYADRISRLQALQDLVRAEALRIGIEEERLTTSRLKNITETAYYRTIYNDQKNEGKVYDFNKISDRQIQAMLAHNWSGSNYSSRIWKNNDAFIEKLQNTIEEGCMTGSSLKDLEDRIVDDCIGATSDEGQRFCASRLIRTEVNYFANQGILMGYQEAGITRYRFLATLDLRTSEICRKLDLKSFSVAEAEAGVNLPPMHPFCRSVTVPDTGSRTGTRWARNPVTGKSMTVPADMSYQEWYDKYVLNNKFEKKVENSLNNAVIGPTDNRGVNDVHYIGKLDRNIYKCVTDDIVTEDVIITEKQIEHIRANHPNDYERFGAYFEEIVSNPDYIIEANKPNSALILKSIKVESEQFKTVVRLATSNDNPNFKNSIITFMKIDQKEWNRIIRNKKILYKSE